MRYVTIIILFLFPIQLNAQRFFSGNGDYSLLINENVIAKHVETDNNGFIDSYVLRQNGIFSYMLSITRVNMPELTTEMIYSEGFKQSYLIECGCKIVDVERVVFKNFSGIRYLIDAELNGARIKGFSISTISSNVLYTVNFLAEESKFNSFASELNMIMNNLAFR